MKKDCIFRFSFDEIYTCKSVGLWNFKFDHKYFCLEIIRFKGISKLEISQPFDTNTYSSNEIRKAQNKRRLWFIKILQVVNLKSFLNFFLVFPLPYWSQLNDPLANIGEKAHSILAGNLKSSFSYPMKYNCATYFKVQNKRVDQINVQVVNRW